MVWHDITTEGANSYTALLSAQADVNTHLRTDNRASVATPSPASGEVQLFDPGGGAMYQVRRWNGSAWEIHGNPPIRWDELVIVREALSLTATREIPLLVIPAQANSRTVVRARLISSVTTTSNGTDHWTFDLQDRGTAGGAGSSMLTAVLDTNGNDWSTAWTEKLLSINTTAAANVKAHSRILTLVATGLGTPPVIAHLMVQMELSGT